MSIRVPYIILIGNVGAGKSTLVEKITGIKGRSSSSFLSSTRCSEQLHSSDGGLLISDTPGANSVEEKFEHNLWISHAMNFMPFSSLLIVVKADTRIDNVIDDIRKYAENLLDLADMLAVCVTHMDQVTWGRKELTKHLNNELGIEKAVFSDPKTSAETLIADLKGICCEAPMDMKITSRNFLKFFKINNSNFKILKASKKEVDEMVSIKEQFLDYLRMEVAEVDKSDLIFEFQSWIKTEIIQAQIRVSEKNNFTFMGKNTANEAGHIANMTNQLRAVLYEVRNLALNFQSQHGISQLRKCPKCGLIWAKIDGCNGVTTCGNLVSTIESKRGMMCNFNFERERAKLTIKKMGEKEIKPNWSLGGKKLGCGADIVWSDMPIVTVPEEFNVAVGVNTTDLETLPAEVEKSWTDTFNHAMGVLLNQFFG